MPSERAQRRRGRESVPMAVKHWSFAGLMLTYWCNAKCASCYMNCSPDAGDKGRMTVDFALAVWRGLIEASPIGCRIHLSGGEPFGDWEGLIELCRRAKQEGLGPLESVETNAFWATDEELVRQRVIALEQAGMGKLVISADPYHQQFVPIERCRLAASVAGEVLGANRVQVRWRDWMEEESHKAQATSQQGEEVAKEAKEELFAQYAQKGRERLGGRAADEVARFLPRKNLADFADNDCRTPLLRSRHVHVDPGGLVMPGTCAGIILGRVSKQSPAEIWRQLCDEHAKRPIVWALASGGPCSLLPRARELGFDPAGGYASKCHLCWEVRRFLVRLGLHEDELGPAWLYEAGKNR